MSLAFHHLSTARILLSVCLLLTLLSPAAPLVCNVCTQRGQSLCLSPFPRRCVNMMNACMSSVLDTNVFGTHRHIPQMGCRSSRLHRTANYSFTSARGKSLQMDIRICPINFCNSAPPQVPPRVLNGLRCPGCFAPDMDVCEPLENISCFSEENKCIDFAGTISHFFLGTIKLAFQGCATADFCDLVSERQTNSFFAATRVHCVDAQTSAGKPNIEE